ncbi:cell wall-active antibiotics response protein LiaF [Bacillus sp. FSL W8-1122]
MKKNRTDIIAYIFFALLVAALLELVLSVGPLIMLIIAAGFIYYGQKRMSRRNGRFAFYIGIIMFVFTLFSSTFFIITLYGLLFYSLYLFWGKMRKPRRVNVNIGDQPTGEAVRQKKALFFKNLIFGDQRAEDQVFSSDNINILSGIGTTNVHFENTVLPVGDTIVIVRGFIGRIQLYVPYDAGVSVEHSAIFGQTVVFDHEETGFNQNVVIKNSQYDEAPRKLRIYTSLVAGDIEVIYR